MAVGTAADFPQYVARRRAYCVQRAEAAVLLPTHRQQRLEMRRWNRAATELCDNWTIYWQAAQTLKAAGNRNNNQIVIVLSHLPFWVARQLLLRREDDNCTNCIPFCIPDGQSVVIQATEQGLHAATREEPGTDSQPPLDTLD